MEYYIVYNSATGAELWRGQGPTGQAAIQQLPEGTSIIVVPQQAVLTAPADLSIIRLHQQLRVDAEAEAVRSRFITPGSGQAMTYMALNAEATAFQADPTASVPFLTAEAAATDTTVEALAAVVSTNAAQWAYIGSRINAARRKAKVDTDAATNLSEIAAAATVDWASVLT